MLDDLNSGLGDFSDNFSENLDGPEMDTDFVRSRKTLGKFWYFCKKCGKFLGADPKKTNCQKCFTPTQIQENQEEQRSIDEFNKI